MVSTFGLTNAPAIFIDMMNRVFRPYLDQFVMVFINAILIYLWSDEDDEDYFRRVLQILRENKLYTKHKKCNFWLHDDSFLGHIVT